MQHDIKKQIYEKLDAAKAQNEKLISLLKDKTLLSEYVHRMPPTSSEKLYLTT